MDKSEYSADMKGRVKKMTCPCLYSHTEAFRIHGPSKKYEAGEWEGIKANDDDPNYFFRNFSQSCL